MLYAISCVFNEEYYLHTFLDHLRDYVDGFIFLDDGSTDRTRFILENDPKVKKIIKNPVKNDSLVYDEAGNKELILRETYELSIDKANTWVLCCDPDERFELRFLKQLRKLTSTYSNTCYGVHFREIRCDKKYFRCDGIWGHKEKYILFPLDSTMSFESTHQQRIHVAWYYDNLNSRLKMTDYSLYHLRMLKSDDRKRRAQLYNSIDPNREFQKIGYDYLFDTSMMELKKIPYLNRYDYSYLPADMKYYNEQIKMSPDTDKAILFTLLYADCKRRRGGAT